MSNLIISEKGISYYNELCHKNDDHLLIDEDYRKRLLEASFRYGVIGNEFFTLIMIQEDEANNWAVTKTGTTLAQALTWLDDNDYFLHTDRSVSLSEAEFIEVAGPVHGPNIINAKNMFSPMPGSDIELSRLKSSFQDEEPCCPKCGGDDIRCLNNCTSHICEECGYAEQTVFTKEE